MTETAILIDGPLDGEPRTFTETDCPSSLTVSGFDGTVVYERTDEYRDEMRVYRYREPAQDADRDFWVSIRDALLLVVAAIEERISTGGGHAL
jgi:hypothetical protein